MNITNLPDRILHLCTLFSTDKEFLESCDIPDKTFVTTIRKGKNKNPGANYLGKIVRGTGCSGTWLLTGEGEMFEPLPSYEIAAEARSNYELHAKALELVDQVERLSSGGIIPAPPADLPLKVARLLVTLLEQHSNNSDESKTE